MAIRTVNSCCGNDGALVEHFIGTAYDVVKNVYDNLGILQYIYDFLNQHGVLVTVDSVDELKALNTDMKYARVYTYSTAAGYGYTDYLYVDDDTSGIIPNDATATGTWIEVASSTSLNNGSAYIPYIYNNGSAIGGETTIAVPNDTIGVPYIIKNHGTYIVTLGYTYDPITLTVTLDDALAIGDEVILLLSGTPAVPTDPTVSDWVQINWLYNGGYAVGGEQVIAVPYNFASVPAIYKNGLRYYAGLAAQSYMIDVENQRVLLTEPLAPNDRLIVQLGGEVQTFIMTDRTVQEVARSANVHENEVILSTNTTQYLNGMKIIYDVVAQKIYGLPTLPTNVYINSVSNGQLTYSPGNITVELLPMPDAELDAFKNTLASSNGYTYIGGLSERFSLPNKWVVVDNAPYYGNLELAVTSNSSNTAFLLGKGKSYDFLTFRTARNTKKNLTFFGSGVPELASDKRSFVPGTGTIIRGPMKTEVSGWQLVNLGIDCGAQTSVDLFGGEWDDPIQCYGLGNNANVFIDNVKTLSHTNLSGPNYPGTHSLLLELLDGAYVGKIELIGGFHGLTLKGTNIDVMDAHCYGQRGDAFIIKSDSAATAADIYIGRIKVGLRNNSGFTDVTMGGIYDAHDSVNIDNVEIGSLQVYNASWGLIPSDANTGYISNLRINSYVAMNVYGNYYSLVIDGRCVGVNIGEHQCSNTSGGISIDPNAVNVTLGNGFSKGSTKSGYALGSNSLVHGNLIADENGEFGVDYKGGVGFDASKITGYSNTFGLVSAVPTALNGNPPQNGWADTGAFMVQLTGKTVTVSGSMVVGTGAVAYTTLDICRPKKRIPIAAWGVAGSTMIPVECYIETNGNLNVVGYASITAGNQIHFSGQYLIY
ncbi:tail protein [Salmonella phage vB_SalP_TR2]|uniref:Tail protein n=1 Tax=Salmonella phage vB_SalP_TR2 TaxID=2812854 RepID=A0A898KC64_9CAUD|nr:tail protein [Salmonella phage vB_SalP_TR2]QSJ04042.1 tail protein [Salmonella phage vB_SalP_TR2]